MANDPATGLQRVQVEAVHASLECAGHHVLVGHFLGMPISGAEAFLDERLGRRLSARQGLGRYPGWVGESVIVEGPDAEGRSHDYPPGAIVVGLDLPGELTRDRLTATVTAALLEYAIRTLEAHAAPAASPPGPRLLEVAAVPVGTVGVGAISVESCVAALVDGVLGANQLLHDHVDPATGRRTWDEVRIAGLDIVEVLGDRAELVAHALGRTLDLSQADAAEHSFLDLAPCLRTGQGGLPAAPGGSEAAGAWQRVIVRDPGREQVVAVGTPAVPGGEGAAVLEFTAIGRRARADRMQVAVDPVSIDALLESAFRDTRPAAQVRHTLYELLIPNDLKTDLAKSDNLQFIVDEHTADLPWEWLTARQGGARPRELAVRGGFLRQFRETEAARPHGRAPHGENALVIGNPPAGGPSLPGATREAAAVTGALRANGFDVAAMVWNEDRTGMLDAPGDPGGPPGARVLDALFSRDWRVLHIASHGRFVPGDSSTSGVVVDDETTLTANVLRQLPAVPELVFLNCCSLGRVSGASRGPAVKGLAASVARELMRIGVRAVVAAGWLVDDEPAVLFADTFYRALLDGAFFGAAVQRSREAVYRTYPSSSTWAAFQCYGDPGWFLRSSTAPPPALPAVVSADELVRRVRTITVLAGKIGLPDFGDIVRREAALVGELDGLRTGIAERGWDLPPVLYEFGRAYGELGRYDAAVDCYRSAWDHPAGNTAPVRLLEQLGNLEIRLAQRRFRASGAGAAPNDAMALLDAAGRHLDLAAGLGFTVERSALLASFHKKAATMTAAGPRHDHLLRAARWYLEARRAQLGAGAEPDPYVTLNWLQMAALTADVAPDADAPAVLDAVEKALVAGEVDGDEQFWARVAVADVCLTRAVLGDPVDVDRLEEEYRLAFDTRSSRRDRDSVVDHLRDIADLHRPADEARAAQLLDLVARLDPR